MCAMPIGGSGRAGTTRGRLSWLTAMPSVSAAGGARTGVRMVAMSAPAKTPSKAGERPEVGGIVLPGISAMRSPSAPGGRAFSRVLAGPYATMSPSACWKRRYSSRIDTAAIMPDRRSLLVRSVCHVLEPQRM